ncbi:MAG: hypothetical protein QM765_32230 [Myxococcales bacterium]
MAGLGLARVLLAGDADPELQVVRPLGTRGELEALLDAVIGVAQVLDGEAAPQGEVAVLLDLPRALLDGTAPEGAQLEASGTSGLQALRSRRDREAGAVGADLVAAVAAAPAARFGPEGEVDLAHDAAQVSGRPRSHRRSRCGTCGGGRGGRVP